MLVAYPEYIKTALSDGEGSLLPEDFGTEFGRRVFSAIAEIYGENGSFDVGVLSESFSAEEVSRIMKLALDRQKLNNDPTVFKTNVAALKKERAKKESEGIDAFDAIKRLREKNKNT